MPRNSIQQQANELITGYLQEYLTEGGSKIVDFEKHPDDFGLSPKQASEFMVFMKTKTAFPYVREEARPDSRFFQFGDKKVFTLDYFVENTIGIVNVGQAVYS